MFIINEFIKKYPFDVPNNMVERIIQSEFENTKKSYPDQSIDEEAYKAQTRPDAVRAVQTYLIAEVVKEEKSVDVTKEEIAKRLDEIAEASDKPVNEIRRNLIKEGRFDALKNDIAQKKVYDWIKEVADIKIETVKRKSEETKIITP